MTNSKTVPFVVKLHCLAEGVLLNWGNASVVIFCVSVSLLNKLLPHNVTLCQTLYCFIHRILDLYFYAGLKIKCDYCYN